MVESVDFRGFWTEIEDLGTASEMYGAILIPPIPPRRDLSIRGIQTSPSQLSIFRFFRPPNLGISCHGNGHGHGHGHCHGKISQDLGVEKIGKLKVEMGRSGCRGWIDLGEAVWVVSISHHTSLTRCPNLRFPSKNLENRRIPPLPADSI